MIDIKENTIKSLLELNFIQEIMNLLSSSSSTISAIVLTLPSLIGFIIIQECSPVMSFGVSLRYKGLYPFFFQKANNPCVNPNEVPK